MISRRGRLRYYYTYTREKRSVCVRERVVGSDSDADADTLESGIPKKKVGVEHGTRTAIHTAKNIETER
jgi:hypothetical protein